MSGNVNLSVKKIINYLKDGKSRRKERSQRRPSQVQPYEMLFFTSKWRNAMQNGHGHPNGGSSTFSTSRSAREEFITPYCRFRRMARAVMHLLNVCRVSRESVMTSISDEEWFIKRGTHMEDGGEFFEQRDKKRPFVTFVADEKCKKLIQLTFDKTEYSRKCSVGYILTDDIRDILKTTPSERTQEHIKELVRYMKRASPSFLVYPYDVQCRLAKCMTYDRYQPNRVITKRGLNPDGVYIILSGSAIEKHYDRKSLHELRPGDRIGEEDIICGCARRTTVVTRNTVEMASIHRVDYRMIINMADDSNDPRYLEICKHDIVFQHFPMRRLYENPGVWTVLSYKFGRLMVKDSNEMEWIYIIKSGEARVIKHLKTGVVHLDQRRRRIQDQLEHADPYHGTKKMINFVAERKYLTSSYKLGCYNPLPQPRLSQSAPPGSKRTRHTHPNPATPSSHRSRATSRLDHLAGRKSRISLPEPKAKRPATVETKSVDSLPSPDVNVISPRSNLDEFSIRCHDDVNELNSSKDHEIHTAGDNTDDNVRESTNLVIDTLQAANKSLINCEIENSQKKSISHFVKTPSKGVRLPSITPQQQKRIKALRSQASLEKKTAKVPPFVQLETLFAGKSFGLRSCLEPDERGPSASLVSAGCEVLQINKKFFMKYADEAILGLINLQSKPFPGEDELLDRLDTNLQWEEFKQTTVIDFLKLKGRLSESYNATTMA